MTICNRCKTEIRRGERVTIIHWHEGDERQHRDCIATLRDRAETAESELAALRAELDALKAENHSAHARAAGADAAIDQFTDLMFGE